MIKKTLCLILILTCSITGFSQENEKISYKKIALDLLNKSFNALENSVKDLSNEDLHFKPEDGGWTVLNCLEHISVTEPILIAKIKGMVEENKLDLSKDLSSRDWLIISQVTDRTNKVITPEPFRPKPENVDKTREQFLAEIKKSRAEIVDFISTTDANLRHLFAAYPYGEADALQQALIIGAHSFRHTMQINEILSERYPDRKLVAKL